MIAIGRHLQKGTDTDTDTNKGSWLSQVRASLHPGVSSLSYHENIQYNKWYNTTTGTTILRPKGPYTSRDLATTVGVVGAGVGKAVGADSGFAPVTTITPEQAPSSAQPSRR